MEYLETAAETRWPCNRVRSRGALLAARLGCKKTRCGSGLKTTEAFWSGGSLVLGRVWL